MKVCGIYCLTNETNGKRYVGQSRDIHSRMASHSRSNGGIGLGAAIAKHGRASFKVSILEVCSINDLNEREQHWISSLETLSPAGYNLTTGGNQNKEITDEVRKLISCRTKAGLTPEVIEARRLKIVGKPKSAEWRAAMSARQKNSEANTERLRSLSRNQSDETRRRISEAKLGKTHTMSDAGKASIADARRARDERDRSAGVRHTRSPEARANMSAAKQAYWAKRRAEMEANP